MIFEELGIQVYGISLDSVEDQAKFHEREELDFPLLSDPDGSAAAKLGAIGAGAAWTNRVTYVVDEKGVLRHRDDQVNVDSHGEDIAELVLRLRE